MVYGLPESPVKGLVMKNVRITADKGMVMSRMGAILFRNRPISNRGLRKFFGKAASTFG